MKYSVVFLVFAIVLSSFTCNKGNQSSDETEIFEFKLNGIDWELGFVAASGINSSYYISSGMFGFIADSHYLDSTTIAFAIPESKEGVPAEVSYHSFWFKNYKLNPYECIKFRIDTLSHQYFIITNVDKVNEVVEGNFEFHGKNDCDETIDITDGYFRLKPWWYN